MADRTTRDWNEEDRFWRENYRSRPYASEDQDYEDFRPAYRFGTESASRHEGREWNEAEPELRRDWDRYEHKGESRSTWDQVKDAARDAWDRVTGDDDSDDRMDSRDR
jgi:hypothetical protein